MEVRGTWHGWKKLEKWNNAMESYLALSGLVGGQGAQEGNEAWKIEVS